MASGQQPIDNSTNADEDYPGTDNGNVDAMYMSLSRRPESDSCESIRKRYVELLAAHSTAVTQLELVQEEVTRYKKQCEEMSQERNNIIRERNNLKQQCTSALRQWDMALRKQNEYKEALAAAQTQREEADEELKQAMAVRMKASKDIKRLTDERNAVMQEYALIMSERDNVHKEMEKLSDDLTQALKKTKTLELTNKQLTDNKQALNYQMETLRREIASALHDRDKALKECNDLREKFGGYTQAHDADSRDIIKSRLEYSSIEGENSIRKESSCNGDSRSFTQGRRRPDTLDQATQEIESLRKALDEMRTELSEAQQEAEVSKRRRDWAFSERDKIVLERESIRTLCDRLRKERDRAVSELAAALRDSDEIKKQRNEICRELSRLKEAVVESRLQNKENKNFRNHSHDSAIDSDMQEWETEIIDMDLSRLSSNSSLGLDLVGGTDDPKRPDLGIYVSSIEPGSIADGKLRVNDCIVRVNHLDCTRVSRRMVLDAIRSSLHRAHLEVRRKRQKTNNLFLNKRLSTYNSSTEHSNSGINNKIIQTIQLSGSHHGLTLETGFYISKIANGSMASKNPQISVGDRILSINNKSLDGLKSSHEAMVMLNDDRYDIITITTMSSTQCLSSDQLAFFPTKEFSNSFNATTILGGHHKMVNSCSQTDDFLNHFNKQTNYHNNSNETIKNMNGSNTNEFIDKRYLVPTTNTFGHSSVYKISQKSNQEKNPNNSGSMGATWDMIREKIDMVRGRRHSKDRQNRNSAETKKKYRNSSPNTLTMTNTFDLEQDAIAELDSVIESYHRTNPANSVANSVNMSIQGVLKRSKRRGKEMAGQDSKNGGTWPKARANTVIQNAIGTVSTNLRKKERMPLSMFLQDSISLALNPSNVTNDNNNQHCCSTNSSHENQNFEEQSNRLSTNLNSDNSIDYSLKTKANEQDLFDYYGASKKLTTSNKPISLNNNKYPSDTESMTGAPDSLTSVTGAISGALNLSSVSSSNQQNTNVQNLRPHSQLYGITPRQYYAHPPHLHPHLPRLPSSQSGESFCFEPTPHCHHAHSPSEGTTTGIMQSSVMGWQLANYQRPIPITGSGINAPSSLPIESGTFPRKRENQRFRIPSNPSVASSSIERTSERASPMPFHVEILSGGRGNKKDWSWNHKPEPGELRRVHIDKSAEPLGIQIQCLESGGVFVSTVSEHSLASQVGLQIGDQLLEVCGINMRSATYQLAANVLRQCGNSITMLVQYSPDKYHELEGSGSGSSSDEEEDDMDNDDDDPDTRRSNDHMTGDGDDDEIDENRREGGDDEEEATPRNTPRPQRKTKQGGGNVVGGSSSGNGNSGTLTRNQISHAISMLHRQNITVRNLNNETTQSMNKQLQKPQQLQASLNNNNVNNMQDSRFLFIETRKSSNLGISLVGGNAVGIFVHSVQPDSLAHNAGLRTGDQILKYNGADLRAATAEEAAYELAKPADQVTVLAQYNLDKYNEIKDKPGDSFYVRCGFDRNGIDANSSGVDGSLQLRFKKDDVLYVDNTMFNGIPGHWRAWKLDSEGRRMQCGIIPSKFKVEEDLLLRRSLGDLEGRGSTSARRSFFRRKKHGRGGNGPSNRDSKELASYSNVSLGWYSDSGTLHEDTVLTSYQRVERLDYPVYRPVLVLGPLSDCVVDKLISDFPNRFVRCVAEPRHCTQATLDQELNDNLIVDYRRKGNYFECTTVSAIKNICDKNYHCLLDISVTSIERLHRHQIYPIVLLIKFKSTKQIKEVKDTRYPLDKVSAKAAKEMYEHALKLEAEYRHQISAVIPGGVNITYMCTQVKGALEAEQSKSLWIPV